MRSTGIALIVLAAAFAVSGCNGEARWLRVPNPDDTGSEDGSPRQEDKAALPPFPADRDLLPFDVGGASRNTYFVDAESINVGADSVIRYTSVVISPSGARSVGYEGLDCTSYAYKLYATGRPDGTWSEVKQPEWRPITFTEINRHRIVLYKDFFCPKKVPVRTPGEAMRALKSGGHPRAEDSL